MLMRRGEPFDLPKAGGDAFSVAVWRPEDETFWRAHRGLAWRTLVVSCLALHLAFAVWFMWSALVVRLPGLGFDLTVEQRFWLPAMALCTGALARFPHSFMVLTFGGMWTSFLSTVLLLVPIFGIGHVVQDPATPFPVLLFWAGVAGFCAGGQISSSSANIALWFPRRLGGTALGINVGLGNLGTSMAQFLIPAVIGAGVFGAQAGPAMTYRLPEGGETLLLWPQNAAYIWLLPTLLVAVLILAVMKNHPARGRLIEQLQVVRLKHCWMTTILYTLTFGTFSGFAGATPILIGEVFGRVSDTPDPLSVAWLGPLVGAMARPLGGVLADRMGGSNVSMIVFVTLICACFGLTFLTAPSSTTEFNIFIGLLLLVFVGAGIGNASVFKQIVMIFPPREASGVLGFSAAVSVLLFGFFVPLLLGRSIAATGSPNGALYFFAALYLCGFAINWWFYNRRDAEQPC